MVNDNNYVFKIYQNRLYFFEFKHSLKIFKETKNQINEQNENNQGSKDPENFLEDLIGK